MRPLLRRCALPVLTLAAALPTVAVAAKGDDAPLPAGYNLMDLFVEACIDAERDPAKAVGALEEKGAKALGPPSDGGLVSLQWFRRAERLMVTYGPGMCAVSSDSVDRDASLRDLMVSRPDDATPLSRSAAQVPDEFWYLAGFQMRNVRKDGKISAIDILAFQDGKDRPVLTLMTGFGVLPADAPAAAPFAAPVPLATAGDVVAFFDTACVQTKADRSAGVDIAIAQDGRWLGANSPRMLNYGLGTSANAVSLSLMPGACGVGVRHLPGAELLPALEALVAQWADVKEVPEADRPDFDDMPLLLAREGHLASDPGKQTMRVMLVGPAKGSSRNQYMLMLQPAANDAK